MKFPEVFEVLVITLSDRAFGGEYPDLSGPRIRETLHSFFREEGWHSNISMKLIPDNPSMLREIVVNAGETFNLIITTGGTGIGPRDITVETVQPLISKEIPGIMEYIRIKYGAQKPNALLSRGIAGITGKSLIYTLPGSLKAVEEYMTEILKTLKHTFLMQYGIDSHDKHQSER